jgi:pimeloyl-ACP methyl ester carboxylesterase
MPTGKFRTSDVVGRLRTTDGFAATKGDRRVIVPDHHGRGRSSVVGDPYGAIAMAIDAPGLLSHLELTGVVVVGHSMGTLVASALAVDHPALVRAHVLVDRVSLPAMGRMCS